LHPDYAAAHPLIEAFIMTYYGSKELAEAFRTVRKNTIQVAEEIPDANYSYRMTPETRSVAETLVHIALTPRFPEQVHFIEHRSTMEGFDFMGLLTTLVAEEKTPRSKSEILELLRVEGEKFARGLEGLSEDFLAERVTSPAGMLPPVKTRFEMLLGPKEHEMHHRAQLMAVERLLGITPHLTRQMQERVAAMKAAQAGR
jgi:uncharacterized damage-inducible protein DinB